MHTTIEAPPSPPPTPTHRPRPTGAVLHVDHLVKRYGDAEVVSDVSFTVDRGSLFGLLGTNGAGKTTTVEILQGLRRATSGRLEVLGLDPGRSGDRLRRRIGAQLQDAALPGRMRVGEALRHFAALHPDPTPVDELLDDWDLLGLAARPFAALSGGERQRLFVALALVGRPEVVVLDELTQNLDPVARRTTWELVRRVHERGTTVILVTHDVEEAEQLCDHLVVLHRGRVVADGAPAAILQALGGAPEVRFTDERDIDDPALWALPGVTEVSRRGSEVTVSGTGPVLAHVGAHLVAIGRPALDLRVERPTLEDRFVALTQEDLQ